MVADYYPAHPGWYVLTTDGHWHAVIAWWIEGLNQPEPVSATIGAIAVEKVRGYSEPNGQFVDVLLGTRSVSYAEHVAGLEKTSSTGDLS